MNTKKWTKNSEPKRDFTFDARLICGLHVTGRKTATKVQIQSKMFLVLWRAFEQARKPHISASEAKIFSAFAYFFPSEKSKYSELFDTKDERFKYWIRLCFVRRESYYIPFTKKHRGENAIETPMEIVSKKQWFETFFALIESFETHETPFDHRRATNKLFDDIFR